MLRLCLDSSLNQNLLYLSLSLCTSPSNLSQVVLPQIYLCWSWMTYLSQGSSPRLYTAFSLQLPIPYQIYKQRSRKNSPLGIETFQIIHTTTLPIFSPSWYPMTTSYVLRFMRSHIWLRDQHIFNHVNMRVLARISLNLADPTWMIKSCGFAGEVDPWTHVRVI